MPIIAGNAMPTRKASRIGTSRPATTKSASAISASGLRLTMPACVLGRCAVPRRRMSDAGCMPSGVRRTRSPRSWLASACLYAPRRASPTNGNPIAPDRQMPEGQQQTIAPPALSRYPGWPQTIDGLASLYRHVTAIPVQLFYSSIKNGGPFSVDMTDGGMYKLLGHQRTY